MTRASNLRQAHWGIVSQSVNTGTNFLLSVLVARSATAAEFGTFAVVMVVYAIGLSIVRTTGSDVLAIRYAGTSQVRSRASEVVTYAAGLGVAFGLLSLGVGALLVGRVEGAYAGLAAALPMLYVQEALRGLAFARHSPRAAALSDLAWAGVQLGVAGTFAVTGAVTPAGAVAAWVLGGVVAGAASLIGFRLVPARQWPHRWFVSHRSLTVSLGAGDVLAYLPANLTILAMPAVTTLAEVGILRAAYLFYGPLGVLILTLRSMILPDAARAGTPRAVHRLLARAAVALGAVAVAWGCVIVAVPDTVGLWLLGESWHGTYVPRVLLGASLVAEAVMVCAVAALGLFELAGRIVRMQLIMSPLTVLLVLALAHGYGAVGAAAGFAACHGASALLAWSQVPAARSLTDARPGEKGPT